jgi:hypothetical protein
VHAPLHKCQLWWPALSLVGMCLILPPSAAGVGPTGGSDQVIGRVVDESGTPLPYLNAVIKGTHAGAFTDANGVFRIRWARGPSDSLFVCGIGYIERTLLLREYPAGDTIRVTIRSHGGFRGNPEAAQRLVAKIRRSHSVQAFTVCDTLIVDDDTGRVYLYAVRDAYGTPSPSAISDVCDALLQATRDSCGTGRERSTFTPLYAIRFQGPGAEFDLVVSEDCRDLRFYQGWVEMFSGSGGGYECVYSILQAIVDGVFSRDGKR